jgi:hypothetical protein
MMYVSLLILKLVLTLRSFLGRSLFLRVSLRFIVFIISKLVFKDYCPLVY